jgi:hypothetical protein
MLVYSPGQRFGNFTPRDLAVNNFQRINPDPNLSAIIHHHMKMRRGMVFEIDTQQTIVKAFYNWHTSSQ